MQVQHCTKQASLDGQATQQLDGYLQQLGRLDPLPHLTITTIRVPSVQTLHAPSSSCRQTKERPSALDLEQDWYATRR